jgi:zinc protease
VATQNERIAESLTLIRSELKRMADDGPTPEELENAKQYLTGSYALRFDTNTKIAQQLLGIQLDNLGIDYVVTRNQQIAAVTIEDVKRAAKRVLDVDNLIVTVVGRPVGLGG